MLFFYHTFSFILLFILVLRMHIHVHLLRFVASYCVRFVPFIIMFYLMRVCWTTILHLASAGDISLRSYFTSGFILNKIDCYHLIREAGGSQDFGWIRRTLFCVNIDTATVKHILPPKDLSCHPTVYCFHQISWSNRNYKLQQ